MTEKISKFLAYLKNKEMSIEICCDKNSIRIYMPDGVALSTLIAIAEILQNSLNIRTEDISVFSDGDGERIFIEISDKEV